MAILRASELREKDDTELEADLSELRKTLMKIRGGLASGGIPEDVGKLREMKKTIARIMTIRHERKLGLKRESKKKPVVEEKEIEKKPEEKADKKPARKSTKKRKKKPKEVSEKK